MMNPELVAILVTAFLQLVGIVIPGWLAHDSANYWNVATE